MGVTPVTVYYVPCHEPGCWVLFRSSEPVPHAPRCRLHGRPLEVTDLIKGLVTEFEAEQGWTMQRPDLMPGSDCQLIQGGRP